VTAAGSVGTVDEASSRAGSLAVTVARATGGARYVSTGALPPPERLQALVDDAYERYLPVAEGEVSQGYAELAGVSPDLFGLAVVTTTGRQHTAGDADLPFAIMSVAKAFTLALVCDAVGPEEVRDRVGANATGLPFDSVAAVERGSGGRTNPMVNPGAIATTSLVPGTDAAERWAWLRDGMSRFAGHHLDLSEDLVASAEAVNFRNQATARLLRGADVLGCDPDEALAVYTRQSCLLVTARDLAVMGATLADGGVNPLTHERVVGEEVCHAVLAVMTTAGLYEGSGDWLFDVGLPGKSGIGGGIVTVSPGKGALGTFAPPLDPAGNSVRGQLAAAYLSRSLGLDIFASAVDGS
jgi:glutaminase